MTSKPTYAELEQRIQTLEEELAQRRRTRETANPLPDEQYLTAILDNTNLPIYLKDADYHYLLINREFEKLAQITCAQIRGKDDFTVFPEPIARLFREQDEEVVRCGTLVQFKETISLADGEHVFLTAKFPLCDPAGRIYAIGGVCTDITALQTAQDKLRESEQRYRSFIENFQGIAFRGRLETFISEFIHGEVLPITGYTEEELLAGTPRWDQLVHPDDLPRFLQEEEVIRNRPHHSFRREYRIIRKDGALRWVLDKGRNICDAGNKPILVEGTVHDITERTSMERALQESEERYRTLVQTVSLGVQISDREGRIILSNPAHHRIQEEPDGAILGRYVWDFIEDPAERNNLQEYYRSIIAEQPRPETYFCVNTTASGREINVQVDWNYLRDRDGRVAGLCSIISDISTRVRAELALRENEQKLKSVLQSCPEGIHMYSLQADGNLMFTGSNRAADTILKIDHSLFRNKPVEEAFPAIAGTEVPDRYREVCRTGISWQTEQFNYADERIRGVFAVHAFQTGPNRMAVFFSEVGTKRRMEEELRKIQKLESVGILAGGIAHDFNNLLTAILGNISMAKLFARTDPGKVLERLTDAENASLRARDLTQQLLTFAKGGAPVKSTADLGEIIHDSTSFMLSGSNVRCQLLLPDDLWPAEIDVGQISQVIQNIAKNADQAMPEGGIITITAANARVGQGNSLPLRPGNYVHLSVTDQGVGIPAKHLTRIFDPYFSTKQEGSGLGLAACHSIIKNHDGLIFAESEYGKGATFHIYLPASATRPEAKSPPRTRSLRSGEYILIMDDDEDVLQVAENMLNLMGFRTATARDGAEAIARYKQAMDAGQPFDGVLLDLTIPGGLGGRETVKQLALLDPEVKAIVSSGYANDPIMADYGAHGFKGVACKPYDMEHLGQVFRDLFDGSSPQNRP